MKNVFSKFDKLDDIIYAPIKLMTDWAGEPLKAWEHKRQLESLEKEKLLEHAIETDKNREKLELDIKRKTEVVRIIAEIDEWKKDQDFERMKAVSDAVMKYQQDLMKLNTDAISAIGKMHLELRDQAQSIIYEKTVQYKELQDRALKEAMEKFQEIEEKFGNNETIKNILIKSVDTMLANVIKTADNFLLGLNEDMKSLNSSIDMLTRNGQTFIQNHLEQFHVVGMSDQTLKLLRNNDENNPH
ncbi:MAG: hypothetical protein HQK70_12600 [Desulfamplus sp.]|nr:hypothetical protein [Desulfamplus sp.]